VNYADLLERAKESNPELHRRLVRARDDGTIMKVMVEARNEVRALQPHDPKRDAIDAITAPYRRLTAHHEAGHAVAAWHLPNARKPAQAVVWFDQFQMQSRGEFTSRQIIRIDTATAEELRDEIVVCLAGMAAEVEFGFSGRRLLAVRSSPPRAFARRAREGDDWSLAWLFAEKLQSRAARRAGLLSGCIRSACALIREHRGDVARVGEALFDAQHLDDQGLGRLLSPAGPLDVSGKRGRA
jgi:hypothetical protein